MSIVARVSLHAEHASINKRRVETGVVSIDTTIESRSETLREVLVRDEEYSLVTDGAPAFQR
jgi:stress response protein YsnF